MRFSADTGGFSMGKKSPTNSPTITYRPFPRYKYQTLKDAFFETGIKPLARHTNGYDSPYLAVDGEGVVTVKAGYAWDGASGPTIDTKDSMRASLAHDALYNLMRDGVLPRSASARKKADEFFHRLLREDGMGLLRSKLWLAGVRVGGRSSASPKANEKFQKVLEAP